ncbi:MAG: hypothetical protein MUE41_11175 [Gemmatimonadaceae bacterium]|nr:hypothetical protein [Gemmatimonadaceae bacterium]
MPSSIRRGAHHAVVAILLVTTACQWNDTAVPSATEVELQPTFGQTDASLIGPSSRTPLPSSMRCRYLADSGRVECDPISRGGLTYRASFQFLDRSGRPMARFDSAATDVVDERTSITGALSSGIAGAAAARSDSITSSSATTRRGLLGAEQVVSGATSTRTRSVNLVGRDSVISTVVIRTERRDLRYPRRATLFQPNPGDLGRGAITALNADSALAVLSLAGPWATQGERTEEITFTMSGSAAGLTQRGAVIYLSGDRARVTRSIGTARSSVCTVDRPTATARCE